MLLITLNMISDLKQQLTPLLCYITIATVSNGGGTAGPSSGDSRQEEREEQFKRLSWDTDRDRCSVSTGDGSPMVRSLVQDSTNSAKSPFDFYDDSQFIDDSPQVGK